MAKLWHPILWLSLLTPAVAPAAEEAVVDDYFIERECEKLKQAAGSSQRPQVAALCGRRRNMIYRTRAAWLEARNELAVAINKASASCGDNCDTEYLEDRFSDVPKDYKIYTLFLVPDEYLARKSTEVLRNSFKRFGESIGPSQAAIWLGNSVGMIDVDHARYYCDRLDLNYNDGPYLLTSRVRPSDLEPDSELMIIKLNSMSSDGVIRILNDLEQELRRGRVPGDSLVWAELKERISTLAEKYNPISLLKWAAS